MKRIITCISMALIIAAALPPARAVSKLPADTPEQAARKLYQAQRGCDRAAALEVATPAAVNKLFGRRCSPAEPDTPEQEFSGCDKTGKSFLCSFWYDGGAVNMRVKRSGSGFRVVSVSFVAD